MGSEVVPCQGRQKGMIASLATMLPHGWMDGRYKKDGWNALLQLVSLSVNTTCLKMVTFLDVAVSDFDTFMLHTQTHAIQLSLALMDLVCFHPLAFIITLLPSTIR